MSAGRQFRRAIVALVAVSLVATAAVATAQPVAWPDGEYVGFFNGGGNASGTSPDGIAFSGAATLEGAFDVVIADGAAAGRYGITWFGSGSALGQSGTQLIEEFGTVEGTDGSVFIVRETAAVETSIGRITQSLPTFSIPPSPSELQITHSECGFIEGEFESKLSGLQQAFASFGATAQAEEGFTALRLDDGADAEAKGAVTKALEEMAAISKEFVFLIADAETDLKGAIAKAEDLMAQLEDIVAGLEGLEFCGADIDTKSFRLGITKILARFVSSVLNTALAKGDAEAVLRLAALAARAGATSEVLIEAEKVVGLLTDDASAAKDLGALTNLLMAALLFGLTDEFIRIEGEIDSIRGTP